MVTREGARQAGAGPTVLLPQPLFCRQVDAPGTCAASLGDVHVPEALVTAACPV